MTDQYNPGPEQIDPKPHLELEVTGWSELGVQATVLMDVDGCVADMSAFEHLLRAEGVDRRRRWIRFLHQGKNAAVIPAGFEVAWALHRLGCRIVFSTTRPPWQETDTRAWLERHEFPPAVGLLLRRDGADGHRPAVDIKRHHFVSTVGVAGEPAALFIDADADVVQSLTASGFPARLVWELCDLPAGELAAAITEAPTAVNQHRRHNTR